MFPRGPLLLRRAELARASPPGRRSRPPAANRRSWLAAAWGALLFLAVMVSIVGYIGWYPALARGGIMRIAPLMFLPPISDLVLAGVAL